MTAVATTTVHGALVTAIRAHLDENDIMFKDLAAAMGCRAEYVTNILTSRDVTVGGRATLRSLQRVLDVLGVDVRVELVDRIEAGP